ITAATTLDAQAIRIGFKHSEVTEMEVYLSQEEKIKLGEILVVHTPMLKKGADAEAFESHVLDEVLPAWGVLGTQVDTHFFRADRASPTSLSPVGSYWLLWNIETQKQRATMLPRNEASGFSSAVLEKVGKAVMPATRFLDKEGGYTDYVLVGAEDIENVPEVALLGAHFIEVKEDRKAEFDAFVRETLHPALVGKIYGMNLLYYKGVRGANKGQYVTIFAIESVQAREHYWPTDASETNALMEAFKPLRPIARELETYLVPDSYLKAESGAAAAIFESLNWTDFALLK
ncbi:MAG: hypothetical protein V3U27_12945, partial [Candidatus Tectomicrobia bacterium]